MSKPNAWVQHVREFAAKNGMPYGCAISQPECRRTYVTKSEKLSHGRASAFESLSAIAGKATAAQAAKAEKLSQGRASAFESLSGIAGKAKATQAAKAADLMKREASAARAAKSRATRERNRKAAAAAPAAPAQHKPVQPTGAEPTPLPIADRNTIFQVMEAYGIDDTVPTKKRSQIFMELAYNAARAMDRYGVDDKPPGQSNMEYALAALIDPEFFIKKIMG